MTHLTRIAVAMGSALDFTDRINNLQEAYEHVAGGGCVEIYQEMADIAVVGAAMLDEIDGPDNPVSWPGVWDYEVGETVSRDWQRLIVKEAVWLRSTGEATMPDVIPLMGRLTLDFFTKDSGNPQYAEAIAAIVEKHTGYRAAA